MIYSNSKRVESEKMSAEIITFKDRIVGYQDTMYSLRQSLKSAKLKNAGLSTASTPINQKKLIPN